MARRVLCSRGMRKIRKARKWSARVVTDSLKVPTGTFASGDPRSIARAVKAAAAHASRPYASAMSYLCFYLNRGGRNLPRERRRTVERAKTELRALFERD